MSYILEGLKKLEQKRKQEEKLPHSLSFQTDSVVKSSKTPTWVYLLVAVLILNAGAIIWWIGPWRSTKETTLREQRDTKKNIPVRIDNFSTKQNKRAIPLPSSQALNQKKAASVPFTGDTGKETKTTSIPIAHETLISKQSQQSPAAVPVSPEKSKPPADRRTVKLSELPADIKKSLPDMKMSAHFYSTDQQARFARVNDRILHEGETLVEGLRVEEINPTGTVFNYLGWRFQIGINENR